MTALPETCRMPYASPRPEQPDSACRWSVSNPAYSGRTALSTVERQGSRFIKLVVLNH